MDETKRVLCEILDAFQVEFPDQYRIEEIPASSGHGHIHLTYFVFPNDKDKLSSYVLQHFNTDVFQKPEIVSANIQICTTALGKYESNAHLRYLRTIDGSHFYNYKISGGETNDSYRMMCYESNRYSTDYIEDIHMAYSMGFAFGQFTAALKEIPPSDLTPAIPHFHDLRYRYQQFINACDVAVENRKNEALSLIEEAHRLRTILFEAERLIDVGLPLRVVHGDAKVSNVLFSSIPNILPLVIDWDTIMPGYFWSDIGDLIRSSACKEDEVTDSSLPLEILETIINGWIEGVGDNLQQCEKDNIWFAGKYMLYMQFLRFLTDWLLGDKYYLVSDPLQNLRRSQSQLTALCKLIDAH